VKITADTNLLVRVVMRDDKAQAKLAAHCLSSAELVAIPIAVLCEVAWVLRQGYKLKPDEISVMLNIILNSSNVVVEREVVSAGLAMLEAGGDFADGVIAHEGQWLGAEEFVSFDKVAVKKLVASGLKARVLTR
jgi:predicted nucleic-acid-binding protein